jgi:thiamine biosynthesis lipoprotein
MHILTLARHAMATRFELVLHGDNPVSLRAAGEEALDEIERLEAQLSLFRPTSEITNLNVRAARESVRVTPSLFELLQLAKKLNAESGGVFDITIAPLVRCWGFMEGSGHLPRPEDLARARAVIGMNLLELDAKEFTVRFARPGVSLDFGAIGKGYAIGRAIELLREAGVQSALLHGGTSTVYALGHPPEEECWRIGIDRPPGSDNGPQRVLATVPLKDEAMSVSAVWGKCFQANGRILGHILDPRTGEPAKGAMLSAVVLPSATETDALSTALLVLGKEGHDKIAGLRKEMRSLVATEEGGVLCLQGKGIAECV